MKYKSVPTVIENEGSGVGISRMPSVQKRFQLNKRILDVCKRWAVLFLILALLIGAMSCRSGEGARPRLVVLIVVDQLRYDYMERFMPYFGSGGFRRLIDNGAFFANSNYIYVPTYTAPGHAAIASGSSPAYNGIVGNTWYDRTTHRERVMVSDDKAQLVTSRGLMESTSDTQPASPRVLIGSTIGDQMRLSDGYKSKVVAISLKDRAAVLPGGRDANGAYWFDATTGQFVSSNYYFTQMPPWVNSFNDEHGAKNFYGKVWDRALPPVAYESTQPLTTAALSPLGRTFPFKVTGGEDFPGSKYFKAFLYSPFASDYLVDFAKAAIEGEKLGTDDYPDLLAISFSTPDYIGHTYGPDSEEIEDTYIRLDKTLENFFKYLDSQVGLDNTVIVLTADHGVSPVPQLMSLHGFDAGTIDPEECKSAVTRALTARFGQGDWVLDIVNDQVYLNQDLMNSSTASESAQSQSGSAATSPSPGPSPSAAPVAQSQQKPRPVQGKVDPAEAQRIAARALLGVSGIVNCFTRDQILNGELPQGPITRRIINGFNASRSGDVWFITKPYYFLSEGGGSATTHGSPYDYDTHVPLIFYGPGIQPGRYMAESSPCDIAPTLAALLRIEPPPNIVGRVLNEALMQR